MTRDTGFKLFSFYFHQFYSTRAWICTTFRVKLWTDKSMGLSPERKTEMDQKWLETCLTAGEFLYGEFPVTVLQKLYETKGEKISNAEIMEFYDESYMMLCDGEMFSPLIATEDPMLSMFKEADKNGNPYASLHYDLSELKTLRKEHDFVSSVDYWIPSASQIEELVEKGYISSPVMTAFEAEIKRRGGDPEYLKTIWPQISTDKLDGMDAIQAIIRGMTDSGVNFSSIDDMNAMMPYAMNFYNSVNLRAKRGWQPGELAKHAPKHNGPPTIMPGSAHYAKMLKESEADIRSMGFNVDYSSIDSYATVGQYGERRIVKVGRNDPCPCGSGKKYKQCHGR